MCGDGGKGSRLTGPLHSKPPGQAPIAQSWPSGLLKSQLRLPQIRPVLQVSGTWNSLAVILSASHLRKTSVESAGLDLAQIVEI